MANARKAFAKKAFQTGNSYIIAEVLSAADGSAKYRFATKKEVAAFAKYCRQLEVLSPETALTLQQEMFTRQDSSIPNAFFITLNKADNAMISVFAAEGSIEQYENVVKNNPPVVDAPKKPKAPANPVANNIKAAPKAEVIKNINAAPPAEVEAENPEGENQQQPVATPINGIQLPDPKKLQEAIEKGLQSNNADYVQKILTKLDAILDEIARLEEERDIAKMIAASMREQLKQPQKQQPTVNEEKERDEAKDMLKQQEKIEKDLDQNIFKLQQQQVQEQMRILEQYQKNAEAARWAKLREEKMQEEDRLRKEEKVRLDLEKQRKEKEAQLILVKQKEEAQKAEQAIIAEKAKAELANQAIIAEKEKAKQANPLPNNEKINFPDPTDLQAAMDYGVLSNNAEYYKELISTVMKTTAEIGKLVAERADIKEDGQRLEAELNQPLEEKERNEILEIISQQKTRWDETKSELVKLQKKLVAVETQIIEEANKQKLQEEKRLEEERLAKAVVDQQEKAKSDAKAPQVAQANDANEKIALPDPTELQEAINFGVASDNADYFKNLLSKITKISIEMGRLITERTKIKESGQALEAELKQEPALDENKRKEILEILRQQKARWDAIKLDLLRLKKELAVEQTQMVVEANKQRPQLSEAEMKAKELQIKLANEAAKYVEKKHPKSQEEKTGNSAIVAPKPTAKIHLVAEDTPPVAGLYNLYGLLGNKPKADADDLSVTSDPESNDKLSNKIGNSSL